MYTQVAYALAVTTTEAVSQAVSVQGANAISVDLTVINASAGTVTVDLDGSNDLANWQEVKSGLIVTTAAFVGYLSEQFPADTSDVANERIGFQYIRLRYVDSTGTSIVSAGVNVFEA